MRRTLLSAVGAVVMLALAGCVGVPTSGGIVAGDVINEQDEPDFILLPSGPTEGASQEDLLRGFMLALGGPQNDYAVARQFLTPDLDTKWDPDASAIIRTGIPSTTAGSVENTLNYTVTARALVDAAGRYTEQPAAQQTFPFAFEKVGGEWRISEAPDGVVLSQQSFNVAFTERPLYFFDPSHQFLIPDVRWFPSRTTVSTRVLNALLAGPASWLSGGVVLSAFPTATTVDRVVVESGKATVQLSKEALTALPVDRDYMRQQLAATLGTDNVEMTVGGLVLVTPDETPAAIINPPVESSVLIGSGAEFGFATGDVVQSLGLSAQIIASGATAVTLASDKQSAAVLTPGGVGIALATSDTVELVDDRPSLIAPSLDPFRFVWSAQSTSAVSLLTFEVNGTAHAIQTGLPADASIVSVDVSRDGARLLVYLTSSAGPQLVVAGIIRDASNVPTKLGEPVYLPVSDDSPVDATWVNDRVVASVARAGDVYPVTSFEIGGSMAPAGSLPDALAIVGGNGGTDGLRVLRAQGDIWRPQGSGWVSTGISASFMATKQ